MKSHYWNIVAYLALWVGMILALGFTEYERRERKAAANYAIQVNCDFGNKNRMALRNLLIDADRRTQTSRQRTQEEKDASKEFVKEQLSRLPLFDCDALMLP